MTLLLSKLCIVKQTDLSAFLFQPDLEISGEFSKWFLQLKLLPFLKGQKAPSLTRWAAHT